ncbi:unnamed protein product [Amoebophrya sp. A120]|nr:unnamed protein product [Amoebophrya sp. A120]|eukprot:GSA120T00003067001.1
MVRLLRLSARSLPFLAVQPQEHQPPSPNPSVQPPSPNLRPFSTTASTGSSTSVQLSDFSRHPFAPTMTSSTDSSNPEINPSAPGEAAGSANKSTRTTAGANNDEQNMVQIRNFGVERLTIYVLGGSQFAAKTLAGLQSRKLPHFVDHVSVIPSRRKLPSGGLLTPEMVIKFTENGKPDEIVPDSDKIFQRLDEIFSHAGTSALPVTTRSEETIEKIKISPFFPDAAADFKFSEIKIGKELNSFLLYYNWIYPPSYERSMKKKFKDNLPGFIFAFRGSAVDYLTNSQRASFLASIQRDLAEYDSDLQLCACQTMAEAGSPEVEERVRRRLIEFLGTGLKDLYTAPTPPESLTGAQCGLYAMMERLAGIGFIGDIEMPPALPELQDEKSLKPLSLWLSKVRETVPILYKGKRFKPEKRGGGANL